MKYCYTCRRLRASHASYCVACGGSFNVRLCPKLHVNSRFAAYCQQCGSADLSVPHLPGGIRHYAERSAVVLVMLAAMGVLCGMLLSVGFDLFVTQPFALGVVLVLLSALTWWRAVRWMLAQIAALAPPPGPPPGPPREEEAPQAEKDHISAEKPAGASAVKTPKILVNGMPQPQLDLEGLVLDDDAVDE